MAVSINKTEGLNQGTQTFVDLTLKKKLRNKESSPNDYQNGSSKRNKKIKKRISNVKENDERKSFSTQETSINDLLNVFLLSVMALLYFLNIYEGAIQKNQFLINNTIERKDMSYFTKKNANKKIRILTDKHSELSEMLEAMKVSDCASRLGTETESESDSNDEQESEDTSEEELEEESSEESSEDDKKESTSIRSLSEKDPSFREKEKDWIRGLTESVMQDCKDYIKMVKDLRDEVFVSNSEFSFFLHEMRKKKKTVEAYAPDLLNEFESEDIHRARILQYYKEYPQCPSELNRLESNIMHYTNLLNYLKAIRHARDEEQERSAIKGTNKLQAMLDYCDFRAGAESKRRLQHLMNQFESGSNLDEETILNEEKQKFYIALYLCRNYRDILERMPSFDNLIRSNYKKELYRIEKELATLIPGFYYLYKWDNNLGPEMKSQDTGFSAKRFRSMHYFFSN